VVIGTIYKMQKIIQLKDRYHLEVGKFMYEYTYSQLPTALHYYFNTLRAVSKVRYHTKVLK